MSENEHWLTYRGISVPANVAPDPQHMQPLALWMQGVNDALDAQEQPESEKRIRFIEDVDGDVWWETSPGLFTAALDFESAQRRSSETGLYMNKPGEDVISEYGIKRIEYR